MFSQTIYGTVLLQVIGLTGHKIYLCFTMESKLKLGIRKRIVKCYLFLMLELITLHIPTAVYNSYSSFREYAQHSALLKSTVPTVDCYGADFIFSVNIENELIYIDAYLNIRKFSNNLQKCTTILVRRDATMEPVSSCYFRYLSECGYLIQ